MQHIEEAAWTTLRVAHNSPTSYDHQSFIFDGLGPDQGARARAALALDLEGRANRGRRRGLNAETVKRRLRKSRRPGGRGSDRR